MALNKRQIFVILLSITTMLIDQGSKFWARSALRNRPPKFLIEDYLYLGYHENSGMAFSLGNNLPGGRVIFVVIGLVVLFVVWRIVRQIQHRKLLANIAFGLISGGAIGNLIDRIYIGRVVDFIIMHWHYKYIWPAYNAADSALCVGVGLLVIALSGQPHEPTSPTAKRT